VELPELDSNRGGGQRVQLQGPVEAFPAQWTSLATSAQPLLPRSLHLREQQLHAAPVAVHPEVVVVAVESPCEPCALLLDRVVSMASTPLGEPSPHRCAARCRLRGTDRKTACVPPQLHVRRVLVTARRARAAPSSESERGAGGPPAGRRAAPSPTGLAGGHGTVTAVAAAREGTAEQRTPGGNQRLCERFRGGNPRGPARAQRPAIYAPQGSTGCAVRHGRGRTLTSCR